MKISLIFIVLGLMLQMVNAESTKDTQESIDSSNKFNNWKNAISFIFMAIGAILFISYFHTS